MLILMSFQMLVLPESNTTNITFNTIQVRMLVVEMHLLFLC